MSKGQERNAKGESFSSQVWLKMIQQIITLYFKMNSVAESVYTFVYQEEGQPHPSS